MSEEARWEGIHPDSLFSRSIEQVMRDWGLVRTSALPSDPPTATVPNKTAEGLDEEDRLSCRHCDDLFRATGISPSTPLPARDCYGGTGIGVWLDDFLDQGYAPEVDRNDVNAKLDYMENHWKYWRDLGVTKIVTSYLSPQERDRVDQELRSLFTTPSLRIISTRNPNRMMAQQNGDPVSVMTVDQNALGQLQINFSPLPTIQDLRWLEGTFNERAFFLDEIYEQLLSSERVLEGFRIQYGYPSVPEAYSAGFAMISSYLSALLHALQGLRYFDDSIGQSSSSQPDIPIYVSTYDIGVLPLFIAQFFPAIQAGQLILMPDLYYSSFEFPQITRYYLELSRLYDEHGLANKKRHIQPYIELKCDPCLGRTSANTPCSPVRVVCDMLLMGVVGFGGPVFYTSGGIDQRFWESAILGSWIMGCLPGSVPSMQFRTIGEAIRFACSLFPEPDTAHAERVRQNFFEQFDVYQNNGEYVRGVFTPGSIYNNPMTCQVCCRRTEGSMRQLCFVRSTQYPCNVVARCCDGPAIDCHHRNLNQRPLVGCFPIRDTTGSL